MDTLEQAKKGIALSQRAQDNKTEPKTEMFTNAAKLIWEGKLNSAYRPWVYEPTNESEHRKLPPAFKKANQDLQDLNKISGINKSKLEALQNQADEWYSVARNVGVTDISKPVYFEGKQYTYPGRVLEDEKRFIAGIEAKGQAILDNLNRLARSEPQVLENASNRVKSIRQVIKVPQSYEELQQGLPPVEKPASAFIEDLRHAEQDKKSIARKVLAEAGLDGDAINHEGDIFDPRSGKPRIDQSETKMLEAKQSLDNLRNPREAMASPTSQNQGQKRIQA